MGLVDPPNKKLFLNPNLQNIRMRNKGRKFSPHMYQKYDLPARHMVRRALGDKIIDNPDKYGQDFIFRHPDGSKCPYKYLEIQVCSSWTDEKYPFPNVWIYARKGRYKEDTLFLTLDRRMFRGYLFAANKRSDEPRRLKKYSREFVYDVPMNHCMLVYLDHLEYDTIEEF